jgi:hypothetical protein
MTSMQYLVMTDGWTIRTRVEVHMLTGSAILWQGSPLYGHWYNTIKAMEHFVPFYVESEEDILDAIKWLREHDEEAELIGQRARDFVLKYLNREARQCYWKEVLTRSGMRMKLHEELGQHVRNVSLSEASTAPDGVIRDDLQSQTSSTPKFVPVIEVIQAILAEGKFISEVCADLKSFQAEDPSGMSVGGRG